MHDGGVVSAPGMYVMGLPFMRRRKSSFIDGAGDDAADLAAHLNLQPASRGRLRDLTMHTLHSLSPGTTRSSSAHAARAPQRRSSWRAPAQRSC